MTFSNREKISHVVRRLGIGTHPDRVAAADTAEAAIADALDLTAPPAAAPDVTVPLTREEAIPGIDTMQLAWMFWLDQMIGGERPLEERLIWFWHDHFATSIRKVQVSYVMWQQHLTLRQHATGSFADLLHAIAVDPAMLRYLDGVHNHADAINENFGREVMELFTIGRGNYTEQDVVAASAAFSGWVINVPFSPFSSLLDVAPWQSTFIPRRHQSGTKTLLGVTGDLDAAAAVDVLLEHPKTAETVGAKLYVALVGLRPDAATTSRLGTTFRRNYSILELVEQIVADPAFVSEDAIRSRIRSPLEKGVGAMQGFTTHRRSTEALVHALQSIGYTPLAPPNVAGFPEGERLLGPHQLVHTFDFTLALLPPTPTMTSGDILARLGIFDVSPTTRDVLDRAEPPQRLALALNAPEYALT